MFDNIIIISELLRNIALAFAGGFGAWFAWLKIKQEDKRVELAKDEHALSRRAHVLELFSHSAKNSQKMICFLGYLLYTHSLKSQIHILI